MGLTIDPEFQAIAPPLKEAEMKLLEESILEKGCLEPILVWYGIIIDGHNRYKICGEHHIPYETQNIEFKNRMEAKLWIIKNQLGRRNLNAFQRCEISLQYETPFLKLGTAVSIIASGVFAGYIFLKNRKART